MAFATPPIASRTVPFLNRSEQYFSGFKECRNCPAESCRNCAVLLGTGDIPDVCGLGLAARWACQIRE